MLFRSEIVIKLMVGVVVISFFAVVVALSLGKDGLPWGEIFAGFVPDASMLTRPSHSLAPYVQASTDATYWSGLIVSQQQERMVAAAATAVGINMTFLLPFSMLKRGWNRDFRGLATFDLSTGLFIPFVLATSCVVLAAAAQFHAKPEAGLIDPEKRTAAIVKLEGGYHGNLDGLLKHKLPEAEFKTLSDGQAAHELKVDAARKELLKTQSKEEVAKVELKDPNLGVGPGPLDTARDNLKEGDKVIAATLIQRDSFALANSLEDLAGKGISQIVFGIGVVGMAISTIIILMLINGFTICEMLGQPSRGFLYTLGCLLPGVTGALGCVYLWTSGAKFYLAVPTSNFGMILLPIAYIAFFFMMNSRKILGDEIPRGLKRLVINVLMLAAVALALTGATVSVYNATGKIPGTEISIRVAALGLVAFLVLLGIAVHFMRKKPT